MILLDSFICIGMMVSYLPQYMRILSLKNSLGFSPNFFLLGSIGVISTLSNLILLQFYGILDCFIHNTNTIECISHLFGILEIFIQFCCFFFLFYLFLVFFPSAGTAPPALSARTAPPAPSANLSSLADDDAHIPSLNDSLIIDNSHTDDLGPNDAKLIWEQSKRNLLYSLLFLSSSIVLVSSSLLYSNLELNATVALVYGLISSICGILQFFPQLVYTIYTREIGSLSIGTMLLQVPGSFILVLSLYSTPGSNWTSYVSYLISGLLQASLLLVCIYLSRGASMHTGEEEVLIPSSDLTTDAQDDSHVE